MANLSTYIGVFLDGNSQGLLNKLRSFVPKGWTWYGDHMTIKYFGGKMYPEDFPPPYNEMALEKKPVTLIVTHIGISPQAIAVKVEGYPVENQIAHITLATPMGGAPRNAKNITNWKKIKSFTLHGTIGANGDMGDVITEKDEVSDTLVPFNGRREAELDGKDYLETVWAAPTMHVNYGGSMTEEVVKKLVLKELHFEDIREVINHPHRGWITPEGKFIDVDDHRGYLEQRYGWVEEEDMDELYHRAFREGFVRVAYGYEVIGGTKRPSLSLEAHYKDAIAEVLMNAYYPYLSSLPSSSIFIQINGSWKDFTLPRDKEELFRFFQGSPLREIAYEDVKQLNKYTHNVWVTPDGKPIEVASHVAYARQLFPKEAISGKYWSDDLYRLAFSQGYVRVVFDAGRSGDGQETVSLNVEGTMLDRVINVVKSYLPILTTKPSQVFIDNPVGDWYQFQTPRDTSALLYFLETGNQQRGYRTEEVVKKLVLKELTTTFPFNVNGAEATYDSWTDHVGDRNKPALDMHNVVLKEIEYTDITKLPFLSAIEKAGGKVYQVGGAVRDSFLGKTSKDLDIMVSGIAPETLLQVLKPYGVANLVGQSFGVIKFKPQGAQEDIDIALARADKKVGVGHKGIEVSTDPSITVEQDLVRRDFTINAIAKDIHGNIIDPFGGVKDLQNKIIRMVSPEAFAEDPLRMLRAIQFAARFGFTIEPHTFDVIRQNANDIKTITAERILEEFNKMIHKGHPEIAAKLLVESGLYKGIFGTDFKGSYDKFPQVKRMSEFIYLLAKDSLPSPATFFKNNLKGDIDTYKELKVFEISLPEDEAEERWLLSKAYNIAPDAIKSFITQDKFKDVSKHPEEKYPRVASKLAISGDEIKSMGIKDQFHGMLNRDLMDLIYKDQLENTREAILDYIQKNIDKYKPNTLKKIQEITKRILTEKELEELMAYRAGAFKPHEPMYVAADKEYAERFGKAFKGEEPYALDVDPGNVLDLTGDYSQSVYTTDVIRIFNSKGIEFTPKEMEEIKINPYLSWADGRPLYSHIMAIHTYGNAAMRAGYDSIKQLETCYIDHGEEPCVSYFLLRHNKTPQRIDESTKDKALNEDTTVQVGQSQIEALEKAIDEYYEEAYDVGGAAYIAPDGYMTSLVPKDGASRDDHRAIGSIIDDLGINIGKYAEKDWEHSESRWLLAIMEMGFIRVIPESGALEIHVPPTGEQYEHIRDLVERENGNILLDLVDDERRSSIEFHRETSADWIEEEIRRFFYYGEAPRQWDELGDEDLMEGEAQAQPVLILPIGISGSGKSRWISTLPKDEYTVISPDDIRRELTGNVTDVSRDKEVFELADARVEAALKANKKVIVDATNVDTQYRKPFLEKIKAAVPNVKIYYKLFDADPDVSKERIRKDIESGKDRSVVPDEIVDAQVEKYKQTLQDLGSEDMQPLKEEKAKPANRYWAGEKHLPPDVKDRLNVGKKPTPEVEAAIDKSKVLLGRDPHKTPVYTVNGELVRQYVYPDFSLGGNDMAYPNFVPKNEIWIDQDLKDGNRETTISHESVERHNMFTKHEYYDVGSGHKEHGAHIDALGKEHAIRAGKVEPVQLSEGILNESHGAWFIPKGSSYDIVPTEDHTTTAMKILGGEYLNAFPRAMKAGWVRITFPTSHSNTWTFNGIHPENVKKAIQVMKRDITRSGNASVWVDDTLDHSSGGAGNWEYHKANDFDFQYKYGLIAEDTANIVKRLTQQQLQEAVKNRQNKIWRLVIFDMDSTLVSTPMPEFGREEWEQKKGEPYPHAKSWWSTPESLDTTVFDIKAIAPVFNQMRDEQRRSDTMVVVMTNRLDTLEKEVKNVLRKNRINPDALSMAQYSMQNKGERVLQFIKDNPDIKYVAFYDDQETNIENVRQALKGKGITYDLYNCQDGKIRKT